MNEPNSRDEILAALRALAGEGMDAWRVLTPEVFAAPLGDAWSPADNVRHLVKSTKPVAQALALPKVGLRAMFGGGPGRSRSFAGLRETYRAALAAGGEAGKYAPRPSAPPADLAAWQTELVDGLASSVLSVERAAASWDEASLDRHVIPHPLIGKLTVREMLFFTIYHCGHHAENVRRRLAGE